MDAFKIIGGRRLKGEVRISGAKNAALPIMAACILSPGETVLHNVPDLRDIRTMIKLLEILGAKVTWSETTLVIDTTNVTSNEAPYSLIKTMRASFIIMGPLLARFRSARVALPGGCAIGSRPVDIHIKGFRALSAAVDIKGGYVEAFAKKLTGNSVFLDFPSVGATENIMLAACLANGETVIKGAAREPEIIGLANFINSMGGRVKGAGTDEITVRGVSQLFPVEYTVMPDRIETGTFMAATGLTRGDITLKATDVSCLESVIEKFAETGLSIECPDQETIHVKAPKKIQPVKLTTLPYPGFPTDMQPQFMAMLCFADGTSIISETIFENRFMHVPELRRMGADISVQEHNSVINGVKKLSGAEVMCSDLRAGAGLVIAALAADGESLVQRIYHVDRGYENFEGKLSAIGARIERKAVPL